VKRALVALGLLAALAGCDAPAAAPAAQPTTTVAGAAAIQWADNLCGAILEYDRNTTPFQIDSSSPSGMITSLTTYLDATSTRINSARAKLASVGPSPVTGGDEATQAIIQSMDTLIQTVQSARNQISGVDPNDRSAVSAALQQIAQSLQGVRAPVNPLEGMGERFPDLQAAARSADNCTEISRTRANRSSVPQTSTTTSTTSTTSPTTTTDSSGTPSSSETPSFNEPTSPGN
jgi:hypothetical protein